LVKLFCEENPPIEALQLPPSWFPREAKVGMDLPISNSKGLSASILRRSLEVTKSPVKQTKSGEALMPKSNAFSKNFNVTTEE
jgi:hypothetical protein